MNNKNTIQIDIEHNKKEHLFILLINHFLFYNKKYYSMIVNIVIS